MTEEEKGNDKKKKGFTWIDDINAPYDCETSMHIGNGEGSYSGAVNEQDNTEENTEVDWDYIAEKFPLLSSARSRALSSIQYVSELGESACQHASMVSGYWSDFVDSAPFDEDTYKPDARAILPHRYQYSTDDPVGPTLKEKLEKMTQLLKEQETKQKELIQLNKTAAKEVIQLNKTAAIIMNQTKPLTPWQIILEKVAENIVGCLIGMGLTLLGLGWLLTG